MPGHFAYVPMWPFSALQAVSPFDRRAGRLREGGDLPRSHCWPVAEPELNLESWTSALQVSEHLATTRGICNTPGEASGYIRAFSRCSCSLHRSIACLTSVGGGSFALVLELQTAWFWSWVCRAARGESLGAVTWPLCASGPSSAEQGTRPTP